MTPNAPKVRVPKLKIPKIAGLPKPASNVLTETRLTAPDYILGLDMSLEHTGWSLHDVKANHTESGVWEPNPNKSKKVAQILGLKRLIWLRDRVGQMAKYGLVRADSDALLQNGTVRPLYEFPPRISCLVLIEGYAFGAKGSSGISLGELGGIIRLFLYENAIPYIEIPPTQSKKFVTGKGGAPKDIMIKEVYKRYGFDTDDNNVADAFSLMQVGRAITNTQESPLLAHQKEVVTDVVKTWQKDHPAAV